MIKSLVIAVATAAALVSASPAVRAGYTSNTVFGDSLSDGGNDFLYTSALLPFGFPPPPYAQRFTNGPTAVEVLAANLGLSLTPSLAGGSNYAFGGAKTGTGNYLAVRPLPPAIEPAIHAVFSGPPNFPATGVAAQVQSFVGANTFAPNSLVVLWAGSNDLFTALALGNPPGSVIVPALQNLGNEVFSLYGAGARTILMPNMPNIGATPLGLTSGFSGALTAFSVGFDLGLDQTIDQLESVLPGLDIIEFDTFSTLDSLIANAGALGFLNTTAPCLDAVAQTLCANPDQYVFWDEVHPTARVNQILGNGFRNVVPEPGSIALLSIGLLGFAFSPRKKS